MFSHLADFILNHLWIVGALLIFLALFWYADSRTAPPAVSAQTLIRWMNDGKARLVDIRQTTDFKQGHIEHSSNHPATRGADIEGTIRGYEQQNQSIVLVCKSGASVKSIGKDLIRRGFKQIFILRGGIGAWREEGFPLTKH